MTKYKISKQELQDHWDDQDEKEAQRLATCCDIT